MIARFISALTFPCTQCVRQGSLLLAMMLLGSIGFPIAVGAQEGEVTPAMTAEIDSTDSATLADELEKVGPETPHEEADEHGESHGEMPPLLSFDFGSAIWNLFIFMLTLLILGVFVWPQILAGLQVREDKIQSELAGAEKANAEAKATLANYQSQLSDAQVKIQEMMAEARANAERIGAGIVEQAKSDADGQRVRALADIESAKSVAISELAGETSNLAMSLARQVVGRELNPQDHAELIRQALERLPSQN
jgi:F-type H+-transporting ATPase subunit b